MILFMLPFSPARSPALVRLGALKREQSKRYWMSKGCSEWKAEALARSRRWTPHHAAVLGEAEPKS